MLNANPFIDIKLGTSCSDIVSMEESVDYDKKELHERNGYIYSYERQYAGYLSRSLISCNGNTTNSYSFAQHVPYPVDAHELVRTWLEMIAIKLGNPSYNTYVNPYKEHFEKEVEEGLSEKDEALITWLTESGCFCTLSINKYDDYYKVVWSWDII